MFFEDVNIGDRLPSISLELTVTRMVMLACAVRDLMPQHHDGDYARAHNARDMFVNTFSYAGFFNRLIADWAGAGARLKKLGFRMSDVNCPGDIMTASGSVTKKYVIDKDKCVDLEVSISNQHGLTTTGSGCVSFSPGRNVAAKGTTIPHGEDKLPGEFEKLIGTEVDLGWGPDMVCKPAIRYWCEALEDGNPLYHDEEFAKKHGYGGVIAPPTMTPAFCQPPLWPPQAEMARADEKIRLDLPVGMVQFVEFEYFSPILIGDRLRRIEKLFAVSEIKLTRRGKGRFITTQHLIYNQNETLVATRTNTTFRYPRISVPKDQTK
ncbi:MaoC family dehydratase N-terminal domain-containing protein [Chloroflexota bacterium]